MIISDYRIGKIMWEGKEKSVLHDLESLRSWHLKIVDFDSYGAVKFHRTEAFYSGRRFVIISKHPKDSVSRMIGEKNKEKFLILSSHPYSSSKVIAHYVYFWSMDVRGNVELFTNNASLYFLSNMKGVQIFCGNGGNGGRISREDVGNLWSMFDVHEAVRKLRKAGIKTTVKEMKTPDPDRNIVTDAEAVEMKRRHKVLMEIASNPRKYGVDIIKEPLILDIFTNEDFRKDIVEKISGRIKDFSTSV